MIYRFNYFFLTITLFFGFTLQGQELKLGFNNGHTHKISCSAFSPDGKYLVTGSYDYSLKVWESSSGKLISTLEGIRQPVTCVAWSPDGTRIAAGYWANTACIWEFPTFRLLLKLSSNHGDIEQLSYSPDGKYILILAQTDSVCRIWDSKKGNLLFSIPVRRVSFFSKPSPYWSHDGKYIVTIADSSILLWDSRNGKLKKKFVPACWDRKNHTSVFSCALIGSSMSPDCQTITAVMANNTLSTWDIKKNKEIFSSHNMDGHFFSNEKNPVGYSANGKYFYTISDHELLLFRTGSWDTIYSYGVIYTNLAVASFSPDSKYLVFTDLFRPFIYHIESGKIIITDTRGHTDKLTDLSIHPGSGFFVTSSEDRTSKTWDIHSGKQLQIMGNSSEKVKFIRYNPDSSQFICVTKNVKIKYDDLEATARLWDNQTGKVIITYKTGNSDIYDAAFSPDSRYVAITGFDVVVLERSSGKEVLKLKNPENSGSFDKAEFSPCSRFIYTSSAVHNPETGLFDYYAHVWNSSTASLFGRFFIGTEKYIRKIFTSSDNRFLFVLSDDTYPLQSISSWDLQSGRKMYVLENCGFLYDPVCFSSANSFFVFPDTAHKAIVVETESGKNLAWLDINCGYIHRLEISPDQKYILTLTSDNRLIIWNMPDGKMTLSYKNCFIPDDADISVLTHHIMTDSFELLLHSLFKWKKENGENEAGAMVARCKPYLQQYRNGSLEMHDCHGNTLIKTYILNEGNYIHIHSSGLFDATPAAMDMMYWLKGTEVIEFSQLKDRYWYPGLWDSVMNGSALRKIRGLDEIRLQPEIRLDTVSGDMLPVHLHKRNGGYGKVSIFINGKEVIQDARGNGFDSSKTSQTILFNLKSHPFLKPGQENTITVKAWNKDSFLQGRGVEMIYVAPKNDHKDSIPSFYAIICGINQYANAGINLKFPVSDANAVTTTMKMAAENLFGSNHTHIFSLTSPGTLLPSKENIKLIFDSIARQAKAGDVLMLYLSGHGLTWGGETGDFYYLTKDAFTTDLSAYNDPAIRKTSTISSAELTEWIKTIPALKQVMIIDACGSGKAVENLLAGRSVSQLQVKAIDRMKDRVGMFIISGCAADAVSYESSIYGQGFLTYALLEAMKGAALKDNKFVDVSLLFNHCKDRVKEMATGVGGIQDPQLLLPRSGSFDIGMLEEKDRDKIVLAQPKTVFVMSNFLDSETMEDQLGLSRQLDEKLTEKSAATGNQDFVFFNAKEFPGACKISGIYSSQNNKIELRVKFRYGEKIIEKKLLAADSAEMLKLLLDEVAKLVTN